MPLEPKKKAPSNFFMSIIEDNNNPIENVNKTISYESSIKRLYKKKFEEDNNFP